MNATAETSINTQVKQESLYIKLTETDTLHLKRIYQNPKGVPVFMLHGSIENGRIFYSKSGKGFAPFLARHGYDVFVADMQGRGLSTPPISRASKYGQVDVIKTDIPAFLNKIKSIKGDVPMHWVSHSWGGVLLLAHMGRFNPKVLSAVHFGSKRRLTARNKDFYTNVLFYWGFLGYLSVYLKGYLPAKAFKMGSDNEPKQHFLQIDKWIRKHSKWVDNVDGFNYAEALQNKQLPKQLFVAAKADTVLGNPKDVKLLMNETGKNQPNDYLFLSKENGNKHDYDHNNMLSHKDAPTDHFPSILAWMESRQ